MGGTASGVKNFRRFYLGSARGFGQKAIQLMVGPACGVVKF